VLFGDPIIEEKAARYIAKKHLLKVLKKYDFVFKPLDKNL